MDAKEIVQRMESELSEFGELFWAYNLPLQMWRGDEGWRVLNYMPRKEAVVSLDQRVTKEQLPDFCANASRILRNLADQFDALGQGKIGYIYYPDADVEEQAKQFQEELEEEKREAAQ